MWRVTLNGVAGHGVRYCLDRSGRHVGRLAGILAAGAPGRRAARLDTLQATTTE